MILALAAKGRKTIAIAWLVLLYSEIVLPGYALGAPGTASYRMRLSSIGISGIRSTGKPPAINIIAAGAVPAAKMEARKAPAIRPEATAAIGGPGQPETGSFHSASNTDMVDLFTGDFSYSIPLMDVDGYPVTIGYNSGITMDQEASWVGLGWNINPGSITRNMRGVPDDFNGTDSIQKTSSIKANRTLGLNAGADVEVVGLPVLKGGLGLSMGIFTNTYRGWGLETGVNVSIDVADKGKGSLTSGLSLSMNNNSQEGLTLSPSVSLKTTQQYASEHGGYSGFVSIGTAYNSRSGMKGLQLSEGVNRTKTDAHGNQRYSGGSISQTLMSFAYPSFTPTISLPYTNSMFSVTLKAGGEIGIVHPSFFISGYGSTQFIAKEDQHKVLPAYGYLNYQNGKDAGALLDFNREKEIPYRESPAVPNIAVPTYTYDVFSVTGEGTGGMFRAYRGDIGFVYDHYIRTKDESNRASLDIGLGNLVHGGVDLNLVRAFTETGPWVGGNPLASTIAFKQSDKLFEAAYFRNPGEKNVNTKGFYDAIGGDDVVTVDLFQPGTSSAALSTTNYLNRYKNKNLVDRIQLRNDNVYKTSRDKRTQVITYLTAKEASSVGFTKFIENYTLNTYGLSNCDNTFPDETTAPGTGLLGDYYQGIIGTNTAVWKGRRLDPTISFQRQEDLTKDMPGLGNIFSVAWKGRLRADVTGSYTISTDSDDGAAIYINGQLMSNRWNIQGAGEETMGHAHVNLVGGQLYDIDVHYFQYKKLAAARLYWEYPDHSRRIIPQDFLYPPPTKDTFRAGLGVKADGGIDTLISKEQRVNSFRKENHISEADVLNPDGRRYVYGLPVYNLKQQEATFSVTTSDGNAQTGMVKYTPGTDDTPDNTKGNDNYFNGEDMPAYAHSFLLTGILSPDYVDLTGNGISDDDPGTAVKFNYSKVAGILNPYGWRAPFSDSAGYNEGLKTDNRDDKGNYVYGEKELWYLHSIESKNMIATFKLAKRDDLMTIDKSGHKQPGPAKRLEEINLYTKADFAKHGMSAVPVKTVHFSYSYRLCEGLNGVGDNTGKLTLDSIWFTYNGSSNERGRKNAYVFYYHKNNPTYNSKSYDRWGNFKDPLQNPGSTTSNVITNAEYPYAVQDSATAAYNVAAWTLDSIVLPSGGRTKITYESDDYAYVQNKRATQLFKIAGFSVGEPTEVGDLTNRLYSTPVLDHITDHLYVGVKVPAKVDTKQDVFNKYLQGLSTTYFKLFVQMPGDKWGSGHEYVPCYATLDPAGGYGILDDNTIWVKIKGIESNGTDGGTNSPLAKAAIQFLRLNLPSKAYPGSEVGDDMGIAAGVQVLLGMASNIMNIFSSFESTAKKKGWANGVDTSRTLVRLNNPYYKKYGGGLRVKRIVTHDYWNAMTKQKESEYGQEYDYTTTKVINGVAQVISSGVATYEPILGGEENPWRLPIQYNQQVAALAPVTLGYTEEPLGESLYPSPSIGYSQVRMRSIHTKNTRSANGYEETKFFTAYDFPTITDRTNLADNKKRYKPGLANFLRIDAKHFVAVSQGFKVELNDMHGKLRSQATYAETDPTNYITYTENFYHVDDIRAEFKHLNNTVMAMTAQGVIDPAASIGKDIELMTDMREERALTNAYNVNLNTDMFAAGILPWLIPSLLNLAQRDENKFRSVAITKVINRHGIVDSIRAVDKGSRVTTFNMLYDSETGEPVLTSTQNEFNDPVYNFTYPAAWAYDGMSGAYKNIGLTLDHVYMKEGRITQGLVAGAAASYFAPGDELLIWSHQKTGGTDCAPDAATFPNSGKIWAVDANSMTSGTRPDIYFINADGSPFTGNDIALKVIRSGRRNINTSIGQVSMRQNPLTGSGSSWTMNISTGSGILAASAAEFKQFWKVADQKKAGTKMDCIPVQLPVDCYSKTYVNHVHSQEFTPVCGDGRTGIPITYTVPEGVYSSTVNQEDAEALAMEDINTNGQDFANTYGICQYGNAEKYQDFTKQCTSGTGTGVRYTVPQNKYKSNISQEDADAKAQADIDQNGQDYANANGDCTTPCKITVRGRTPEDTPDGMGPFGIQIINYNTGLPITYTTIPHFSPVSGPLPYCIAFDLPQNVPTQISIGSMQGIYAIVFGEEKFCRNSETWQNLSLPSEIIVSKTPRPVYGNNMIVRPVTRDNCTGDLYGTTVPYTVPQDKYHSIISPEDADRQANDEIDRNGQDYANANGSCVVSLNSVIVQAKANANTAGAPFNVKVTRSDGTVVLEQRFFDVPGTPFVLSDATITPGGYTVQVSTTTSPMNVYVNGVMKSLAAGGASATWSSTNPVIIEVAGQ